MASLTHVCMWKNNGWKNITADEAARLHPGGGVSAHSGLFMCELCGQYVLLTDGNYQRRHFRHSSAEKSKDCPERVTGAYIPITYDVSDHELPMRIKNITRDNFEFELGFIPVPNNLYSRNLKISIQTKDYGHNNYIYSGERLNIDGITYLSVGNDPSTEFSIQVDGCSDDIYKFWPKRNIGIVSSGTVFDANSGRKMINDSDVVVGKKYYILCRSGIYGQHSSHISVKEVTYKRISWETWKVYEVVANDYSEQSARFFLDFHCRLTETPIEIQPVWPVYIENKYVIKHSQSNIFLHIKGNATNTLVFPETYKQRFNYNNETVLKVSCNSRQQLISAGRTKALNYAYFWKEPLNNIGVTASVEVTDIKGNLVDVEQPDSLPKNGKIIVNSPYDGFIEIFKDNKIVDKRILYSEKKLELDQITWGTQISIFVGMDLTRKLSYLKVLNDAPKDEIVILQKLNSFSGKDIKIPHAAGSMASKLEKYPKVRLWLYQRIRRGVIDEQAYRYLIILVKNKKL